MKTTFYAKIKMLIEFTVFSFFQSRPSITMTTRIIQRVIKNKDKKKKKVHFNRLMKETAVR